LSQSELGRRVGVSQATIYKLLTGESYGTKHLHRVARELNTTTAYLTGETDDPALSAPSAASSTPQLVMMPVSMPSENALADMFEGLLLTIHELQPIKGWRLDELAREIAQLLPTGLSQLQGRLLELPRPPRQHPIATKSKIEAHASDDREQQR